MDKLSRQLLFVALGGHFAVALLHYVMPFLGSWSYGYFGAPELTTMAEDGSSLPAVATFALAVSFTIFGFMGLSAAGVLHPLGIIRPILWVVGGFYTIRGVLAVLQIGMLVRGDSIHLRDLSFSLVALLIGVIQLLGLWRTRSPKSPASSRLV